MECSVRWTAKRKAEIVVAIKDGEISTAEAKRRYEVSDDELAAWIRDYDLHGRPGLLVTKLQQPHRRTKNCGSRARRLGQSASGCPAQGQLANRTNVTFKPTREPGVGSAAAQAADASALVSPALPSGVRTRRLCACERWRRFPRRRSQITVRAKIKVGCGAKPSCPARDRRRLQGSNSAICWRQPRASTAAKHRPRPPFPAPATDAGVPCRYDLVSSR